MITKKKHLNLKYLNSYKKKRIKKEIKQEKTSVVPDQAKEKL